MTITNVFIANLSEGPDPLDWGGEYTVGNLPSRLGPYFPPSRKIAFHELIHRIESGQFAGKRIDWGAWAACASKRQISEFIDELYSGDPTYADPLYAPHLFPLLDELRSAVDALPEERFALVGSEL